MITGNYVCLKYSNPKSTRLSFKPFISLKNALTSSSVRLQWDPDLDPTGKPLKRRAIQLGLRGKTLKRYSREVIIEIIDLSGFVAKQREHINSGEVSKLMTPKERVYFPENSDIIKRLNLSKPSDG